jgi:hypothetical protein
MSDAFPLAMLRSRRRAIGGRVRQGVVDVITTFVVGLLGAAAFLMVPWFHSRGLLFSLYGAFVLLAVGSLVSAASIALVANAVTRDRRNAFLESLHLSEIMGEQVAWHYVWPGVWRPALAATITLLGPSLMLHEELRLMVLVALLYVWFQSVFASTITLRVGLASPRREQMWIRAVGLVLGIPAALGAMAALVLFLGWLATPARSGGSGTEIVALLFFGLGRAFLNLIKIAVGFDQWIKMGQGFRSMCRFE